MKSRKTNKTTASPARRGSGREGAAQVSSRKQTPSARVARRPLVAATFAMTIDGKITTRAFSPVDFTSREDKLHLQRQRSLGDAVLIGRSTLSHDNVRLGLPDPRMRAEREARGQARYPLRVIVSNAGRIDPDLKIFQSNISPVVIFSTTRMPRKYQKALREKATLRLSETAAVDLKRMLQTLANEYRVRRVACEGGAELFRSLLELRLVDLLNLTIAPFIFGGKNAPTLTGTRPEFLPGTVQCSLLSIRRVGDECFVSYRLRY